MSLTPYGLDRWLDDEIARVYARRARAGRWLLLGMVLVVSGYLAFAAVTQSQVPSSRRSSVGAAGALGRPAPRETSWALLRREGARVGATSALSIPSPKPDAEIQHDAVLDVNSGVGRRALEPALQRVARVSPAGLITQNRTWFDSTARYFSPRLTSAGEHRTHGKEVAYVTDLAKARRAAWPAARWSVPAEATDRANAYETRHIRKNAGTPFHSAGRLAMGCDREPALAV